MGCSNTRQINYSVKEDLLSHTNETCSYISPHISNFEDVEKNYKEKSFITELIKSFSKHANEECFGYRKPINEKECEPHFTFFKTSQIKEYAENFSRNLISNKFCPNMEFLEEGNFSFLGIFAKNCVEWGITDLACQMNQITSVTFYSTLGDVAFDYIAKQTKLTTLCISPDSTKHLISYKEKFNINSIKNVILFDYTLFSSAEYVNQLEKAGFTVHLFSKLMEKNPDNEKISLNLSKGDTILSISYTSGTTGVPKGVKLMQKNLIAQVDCILINSGLSYTPEETVLIYLPLAHIMERLNLALCLLNGVKTGFISGDVRTSLSEDIEILQPTIFVAVPRVLQLFRQKILDTLDKLPEGCKKNMAQKALRTKRENFKENNTLTHFVYDKLVFSKIKQKFGGKIKYFLIGSAPLSEEIGIDIKIFFSCHIVEGYGLTECAGVAVLTHSTDPSNTCAGGPLNSNKIKLVDIPEMKYDSKTLLNGESSPTGEICIYGPTLFNGYFLNPKATGEALDSDGWFHTGDIGRILPTSRGLKIIDRKKEIFKLSQGEYIAPSKLEGVYAKCRYVQSICVYGNSLKTFLVAIIIPNREAVLEFLRRKGKTVAKALDEVENIESNFFDVELHKEIKDEFDKLAKESNFNSLEKILKFYVSEKDFTMQNGSYTPTMKLVRNVIAQQYEKEINKMYVE